MIRQCVGTLAWVVSLGCVFVGMVAGEEGEAKARYEEEMQRAQQEEAAGRLREARERWAQGVRLSEGWPAKKAVALWKLAQSHAVEGDDFTAAKFAEELLVLPEVPEAVGLQAQLCVAKAYAQYGNPASWIKVREACEKVLLGREIGWGSKCQALRLNALALRALDAHMAEEFVLRTLVGTTHGLEREKYRLGLAWVLLFQGRYEEAREVLEASLVGLLALGPTPFLGDSWVSLRAERQLLWARTFYDATPSTRARLELGDVLSMPGEDTASKWSREASLRMYQQGWRWERHRVSKVLFIGSSHTLCGNIPLLVEQLAASAPEGAVRMVAGEHAKMGTGLRSHWEAGEGIETARGKIEGGVWDAVVVETFFRTPREVLLEYGRRYAERVEGRGARLVVYETPVAKAIAYPEAYEAYHETNVWLGKALQASVAPSVLAWMQILGKQPSEEALRGLYADWIHANARGAYLSACTIYAALTERSPEGLFVPKGLLTSAEAAVFQKAAWSAYCETRERIGPRGR